MALDPKLFNLTNFNISHQTQEWGNYVRDTRFVDNIPDQTTIENKTTGDCKTIEYKNGKINKIKYRYTVNTPGIRSDTREMHFSRINGINKLNYFEAYCTHFLDDGGLTLSNEYLTRLKHTAKEIKYVEPHILSYLKNWAKYLKI